MFDTDKGECLLELDRRPDRPSHRGWPTRPLASPGALHFYELTEETLPCLLQSGESASVSL